MRRADIAKDADSSDIDPSEPSMLEFCFDTPLDWNLIRKPLQVRFRGWMVSFSGLDPVVTLVGPKGEISTYRQTCSRPDVVAHFLSQGRDVPEICGFDFQVDIPEEVGEPYRVQLEVENDLYRSGLQEFVAHDFTSMRWQSPVKIDDANTRSRSNYKGAWNDVSVNVDQAKISVAGYTEENEFDRTADFTLNVLEATVAVYPQDIVLEIGCGVGRMAKVLSPKCRKWIGSDVSENMLGHAAERCAGLDNVEFVPLNGWDLSPLADSSLDVVYCTVVFMHLDEWDRFNYVCEAFRVLKPGGRLYVDNYNILSRDGWDFFMTNMLDYHPLERPSNISKSSTPQELEHYLLQAGFDNVQVSTDDGMWVYAWGCKPG